MDNSVSVNKIEYFVLKNLYENAVKTGEEQFEFKGKGLLTSYAKYLLQYLEPHFEKES